MHFPFCWTETGSIEVIYALMSLCLLIFPAILPRFFQYCPCFRMNGVKVKSNCSRCSISGIYLWNWLLLAAWASLSMKLDFSIAVWHIWSDRWIQDTAAEIHRWKNCSQNLCSILFAWPIEYFPKIHWL